MGRLPLWVPAGATLAGVRESLSAQASGRALADDWQRGALKAAIYGRLRPLDTPLHDGDRVELLGELSADPKVARQRRVEKRRAALAHDKWRGSGR
ncbi:MAG: RnfH family protein [Burkholderiaceae bacterium]